VTPFILIGRRELPPENEPAPQHVYDADLQIWIDSEKNLPLVQCLSTRAEPTQFGETTLTETREGADRPEGASVEASNFRQTIRTQSREGVDQTEATAVRASQIGETTLSKTQEGAAGGKADCRVQYLRRHRLRRTRAPTALLRLPVGSESQIGSRRRMPGID
jgi:hypothetical protein